MMDADGATKVSDLERLEAKLADISSELCAGWSPAMNSFSVGWSPQRTAAVRGRTLPCSSSTSLVCLGAAGFNEARSN